MERIVEKAIESVKKSVTSFCKFISANDSGLTGANQAGFYMPKNAVSLMFDAPCEKGENKDRFVTIKWQDDFETQSRFIYYGQKSRNEYRLTRFGKGFPFLCDDNVGDLLVLSHINNDFYEGFVLARDEDIEDFFTEFNISPSETNKLIDKKNSLSNKEIIAHCFSTYVKSINVDFPATYDLAQNARNCYNRAFSISPHKIAANPDNRLLKWIETEYELFKAFENDRYSQRIQNRFKSVEELIEFANTILNRRKSRAGKSLEHHLEEIFSILNLSFTKQATTEDHKKPDFLFPDEESYHNPKFSNDKLVFLASKTTCKDRWRQVLNEADRIQKKHLFTLQQGISKNQLNEMYNNGIILVVPKPYIESFPKDYRNKILSLDAFVKHVKTKQSKETDS